MANGNAEFIGSSIDDLLATPLEGLSKQARWHLISRLEERVRLMTTLRQEAVVGSIDHYIMGQKLIALMKKWLEVWDTFFPQYKGRIHFGAHE
jgi:hypothetical protein